MYCLSHFRGFPGYFLVAEIFFFVEGVVGMLLSPRFTHRTRTSATIHFYSRHFSL